MRVRLPILWYRDFYDVPRLMCIRVPDGYLIFDCQFDDVIDEYPSKYAVKLFAVSSPKTTEEIISSINSLIPIADISVAEIVFDETRRSFIEVPEILGDYRVVHF